MTRIQGRWIGVVLGVVVVTGGGSAWAGISPETEAELNRAQADFYQALKKGKAKTPEKVLQLRKEILEPAARKHRKAVRRAAVLNAERELSKVGATRGGTLDTRATKAAGSLDQGKDESKAPAREEVVLDGSKIERELSFPGKGKGAPTAEPSAIPLGGEKVEELSFPGAKPVPVKQEPVKAVPFKK